MGIPIQTSLNVYSDWDGAFHQYKADANTSYICRATVGTSLTSKGWQIFKLFDDASARIITWPQDPSGQASTEFIFIASNFAGYTYS